MKLSHCLFITCLLLVPSLVLAESATEREVKQTILDGYAYLNENAQDRPNSYSKQGALEFWSSGGMMHEILTGSRPEKYEMIRIEPKHIQVITLVEGQAAVAMFYSEGAMKPEGSDFVPHYLTRATQVFVKEDGQWKTRASHWSQLQGGSGTSQTFE